ncbi:MAG TPA: mechanosensitive ion channel family protein [Chloroflexi bacterium]|nr:mechanosensitive ion channel family protein [Chloroflexota bacterium]
MEFETLLMDLLRKGIAFIPNLIVALVVFVATLLLAEWAARSTHRAVKRQSADSETMLLLSRIARWTVLIIGTVVALQQVRFDVTGFVAGLGLLGFTIGFALQDISRNFVAGILLLVRQPFGVGDAVEVAGHAGSVLDINVRDTVLKTWDGEKVILPNMDVFANPIINYTELPLRRRTIRLGLGYGEDVNRAKRLFMETIRGVEGVATEPVPELLVEELGDSALTLVLRFWIDQSKHALFGVHSAVVQAIKEVAEREEIDLPYPTQTVRVEGFLPGEPS